MTGEEGEPVTIQVQTTVLPGGKVEVVSPDLPVGQPVTVTIAVKPPVPLSPQGVYDFLMSLPPSSKTAEEWEQFERDFQAERDSWDR